MKSFVVIVYFTFLSHQLLAQGPSLTKDETVNYIINKIKEADGKIANFTYPNGEKELKRTELKRLYIEGSQVFLTYRNYAQDDKIRHGFCEHFSDEYSYSFNIKNLIEILPRSSFIEKESPVYFIVLKLNGDLSEETNKYFMHETRDSYYKCRDWRMKKSNTKLLDVAYFPYFKNDPTNFDKIKKALLYLKELCDAEEDPFGD